MLVYLCDARTATQGSLACIHHVQLLPAAFPPFLDDQRGAVSAAYDGRLCSDFLLKMSRTRTSSLP